MTRFDETSKPSGIVNACSVLALLAPLLCSGVSFAAAVNTVDVATLSTATGDLLRLYGSAGNGSQGVPVAGGFDCNGDGKVDFGMAAFTASPLSRIGAGEIYLVFGDGSITGALDTDVAQSSILRIAGDQTGETAGDEIWIDDVTGDNIGDLLIGRQNYTPGAGRLGAGALTIVVGGSALSDHAATLAYLDLRTPPTGVTITTIEGDAAFDRVGIWMRTGDVTGDGIADIVVGADQEWQSGEKHAGAAYVIRGGSHLAVNQTVDLATFGTATPDLEGDIAKIIPPEDSAHYHFGSTCQIGDLDGNGLSEVMLAAGLNRAGAAIRPPGASSGDTHATGGSSHGTLYIAWDDNFTGDPWTTNLTFDISDSPGSHSIIHGGSDNVSFGEEILGGVDYDNDGNADLFVGDLVADVGFSFNAGTGHVLYNAAALKNQEFDIDSLPMGQVMTTFLGGGSGDIAADTALQGDFDGDGIGDLAFSSPHGDPLSRSNAGIIHVIYGQHGVWPPIVDVDSSSLPSAAGVRVTEIYGANGAASGDQGDTLAYSAAAGDIDGDGRIDVITNEMVGNGIAGGTVDVGNLILVSGTVLDSTVGANLRGDVLYHSSASPVAAVTVDLTATPSRITESNAAGNYGFPVAEEVNSAIQPTKAGGYNGAVDTSDASLLLQALVGLQSFDAIQSVACDVSGNGALSALDAAMIAQFADSSISSFAAATTCGSDWVFSPSATVVANQTLTLPSVSGSGCTLGAIDLDPLDSPADDQSFTALLFGDCTASWTP